jgi:hypothetical protein
MSTDGVAQVVKCLPTKCQDLEFNSQYCPPHPNLLSFSWITDVQLDIIFPNLSIQLDKAILLGSSQWNENRSLHVTSSFSMFIYSTKKIF